MAPPDVSAGKYDSNTWWMSANFPLSDVGMTSKVRLDRCTPPLMTSSSMPSRSRKCRVMSSTTSGLAVAVRHSTGGVWPSAAFSWMKRPTYR